MSQPSPLRVRIQRLPNGEGLTRPTPATPASAGCDLHAAIEDKLVLAPGQRELVPTGFRIELPPGYEAQVRPRSGLALHYGVTLPNAPGTIDADYRGEVGVILQNGGEDDFVVARGDRIAQLVVSAVVQVAWDEVDALDETERGEGGFGHSGRSS